MKKSLLVLICLTYFTTISKSQDSKMMAGINYGVLGPACTNCTATTGGGVFFDYAVLEKLAVGTELGLYGKSETSFGYETKISVFSSAITGRFYPKEAFKGFFIGGDLAYLSYSSEFNGSEVYSTSDFTFGLNLGWVITIANVVGIVPYLGYGTWFENSKGRISLGGKVAIKF